MCKKISFILSLLLIMNIGLSPVTVLAEESMNLTCKSALLIEAGSGKVLYEKNSHEKLPPASVTKIMTMLLTMEALQSGKITLDDKVTISKNASDKKVEGTKLLLEFSEVRTVNELLLGIAIESANDACIAMGEHIAGSEEKFVELMNTRAQELGMLDTTFKNPHGLHVDGHVTSANDIGIMSRELLKHEKIFDYISQYMVTVHVGRNNDVQRDLVNKNKMVRFYDDVDGIKTGFTNEAGFCMSLTAKKDDLRLISVIMGSPANNTRNIEARKLIDYGFANYASRTILKAGETIGTTNIKQGDISTMDLVVEKDVKLLVNKSDTVEDLYKDIQLMDNLKAPIKKGDVIGQIIISSEGKELMRENIISSLDIKKANVLINMKKILQSMQ